MSHCSCWDSGGVCCYCDWEHEGSCTHDTDVCITENTPVREEAKNQ